MKGLRYFKKFIGFTAIVFGAIVLLYITLWTTGHNLWKLFVASQTNTAIDIWPELFRIAGRFMLSFILAGVFEVIGIVLIKD